jgi:hypothetical protein
MAPITYDLDYYYIKGKTTITSPLVKNIYKKNPFSLRAHDVTV